MRLFKPDCYAIITAGDVRLDLSTVNADSQRRLDMSFNTLMTATSEPNSGECVIYNLSESTRNKIAEKGKVEVYAGYDGMYKLISIGDIVTVNNRQPRTDWATTITWGDGMQPYLNANFTRSYKEGVNLEDIFKDLYKAIGLAVDAVKVEGITNGGLSITGKAKDLLNKLTKDHGLTWSIQDNEVRVVKSGEPIDQEVIIISPETGLLEFPQISEKGIDFVAQLNTDLRPNKLVDIRSAETTIFQPQGLQPVTETTANGLNIVNTVRFVGDNFGGQFTARCTCRAYSQ